MSQPRLKVYIAGPISRGILQDNIDQSREAARRLMEAGFAPLNPMLSCFSESNTPHLGCGFTHQEWIDSDLPWVASADALLRLPGESKGADMEVAHAEEHGIPVYHSVQDLIAARRVGHE